jgi:arylsulfatase A-like enzyme
MKNVILITIDCLRADHLSCLGYSKETTPTLDNLATEGILFSQAISTGTSTPISFPGILASTYPQYRLEDHRWLPKDKLLISEILKREGYKTAAFHSTPFLSSYYSYDHGFDVFYDSFIFEHAKISEKMMGKRYELYKVAALKAKFLFSMLTSSGTPYKKAEPINRRAIQWLKSNTDNFFLWLHYMDTHPPYLPPKKYLPKQIISRFGAKKVTRKMILSREKITDEELKSLMHLYESSIRYVDQEISSFLNKLKKMGIYDSTFIIVTADHGEEFREHGKIGHGRPRQKPYEELIHVPLIVRGPGLHRRIISDQVVSLLDIPPMILDLLDIPEEIKYQGKSLLPVIRGEKRTEGVISESYVLGAKKKTISYRTPEWKFVMDEKGDECVLYNLQSDPKEEKNLYEKERERAKEFESKIKEHIAKQEKMIRGLKGNNEIIKKRIRELKRLGKI